MIALFSLEPRSLVVAFMLTRLRGAKAMRHIPGRRFFFDDVVDASTADYDRIYSEYREQFGKMDFLEDLKLWDVISGELFWAMRYTSRDSDNLAIHVLGQIASSGSKGYLSESTPESDEMRSRVKKVLAEFNRAIRFVKFRRFERPALSMAAATFRNDIADMVLRAEAIRVPGNIVAIEQGKIVRILHNGEPYIVRHHRVPLTPERRDFQRFWEGFPQTAKSFLERDEIHALKEMPKIVLPKTGEQPEGAERYETATLYDFEVPS